jgi:hypothetical protein
MEKSIDEMPVPEITESLKTFDNDNNNAEFIDEILSEDFIDEYFKKK